MIWVHHELVYCVYLSMFFVIYPSASIKWFDNRIRCNALDSDGNLYALKDVYLCHSNSVSRMASKLARRTFPFFGLCYPTVPESKIVLVAFPLNWMDYRLMAIIKLLSLNWMDYRFVLATFWIGLPTIYDYLPSLSTPNYHYWRLPTIFWAIRYVSSPILPALSLRVCINVHMCVTLYALIYYP